MVMELDPRVAVYKATPESLSSEKLRALYRHWDQLRGIDTLPRRRDLSPIDFAYMLGQVTIVDVLRQPINFAFRLIGTQIEELGRQGDQGKTVDQIRPAYYRQMCEDAYKEAVEAASPLCLQLRSLRATTKAGYERMILPFTSGDGQVDVLLDAMDWSPGTQIELKRYRLLPSADVPVDFAVSRSQFGS